MNKKTEYTKGKWWIEEGHFGYTIKAEQSIVNGFDEDNDIEIAETNTYLDNEGEAKANAQLIAAAPNMHEKLTKVKEWLERLISNAEHQLITCRFITLREAHEVDIKNYRATINDIEQALNKADGKT